MEVYEPLPLDNEDRQPKRVFSPRSATGRCVPAYRVSPQTEPLARWAVISAQPAPASKKRRFRSFGQYLRGDGGFPFVMTFVNAAVYFAFTIVYFICLVQRKITVDRAVAAVVPSGIAYSVSVTSPFYVFLSVLVWLLPVCVILWACSMGYGQSRRMRAPGRAFVIFALVSDILAMSCAISDVIAYDMIF